MASQSPPSGDVGPYPRTPEPRSFAASELIVGEFTRVDPKGKTDRQLMIAGLKASEAVHACLEEHRHVFNKFVGETELAALDSTEKRQALQGVVLELKEAVIEDRGKLEKLTLALGVEKPKAGEKKPHGHGLATWGVWKVVGVIGGSFSAVVFLYRMAVAIGPDLLRDFHLFMMSVST